MPPFNLLFDNLNTNIFKVNKMVILSPWNIISGIIFLLGLINSNTSIMAVGALLFIIGIILKLLMKVD